ncbi:hypothetical protein GQX74_010623 [Glossina fuscipes]|nr:hypothetical protein GQX74_010623 [Glossina fuscipes]
MAHSVQVERSIHEMFRDTLSDPAIISNVPLVADVYNLISGPIFIIWHLNIIITTIQQRRNSDLAVNFYRGLFELLKFDEDSGVEEDMFRIINHILENDCNIMVMDDQNAITADVDHSCDIILS